MDGGIYGIIRQYGAGRADLDGRFMLPREVREPLISAGSLAVSAELQSFAFGSFVRVMLANQELQPPFTTVYKHSSNQHAATQIQGREPSYTTNGQLAVVHNYLVTATESLSTTGLYGSPVEIGPIPIPQEAEIVALQGLGLNPIRRLQT